MRISVIIPAYNAAETIREALESVYAQSAIGKDEGGNLRLETGGGLEVIVVDDASTDGTASVLSAFIGVHPRLHVLSSENNAGPAAARNEGIREATGEWIAFLDADDTWMPDRLAVGLAMADQYPDAVMFCGETGRRGQSAEGRAQRENGEERDFSGAMRRPPCSLLSLGDFIAGDPVATSTVLVKKSAILEAGGFDEQFRGPEDYDLWMRMAARGRQREPEKRRNGETGNQGIRKSEIRGQRSRLRLATTPRQAEGRDQKSEIRGQRSDNRQPTTDNSATEQPDNCPTRIVKIHAPLACYRERRGSLSMDDRTFLPQVLRVLDKAYAQGGALHGLGGKRRAKAHQYLAASWTASERGAAGRAISLFLKSLTLWLGPLGAPDRRFVRLRLLKRYAANWARRRPDSPSPGV